MHTKLTIAHYIRTLAEQYQDRPAIHFKSAFRTFGFTYREIHERCLRVANYLAQKGIHRGDRVLIWSYNGQEYGSILLGCALSGVVVVPIDFGSKADLVGLIARKVGAKHLFHSKRRPYPHPGLGHIHVEDLDEEIARVPIATRDFEVAEDDAYEIVYTSGTTSDPKGVVLTNRNIVSNIYHCAQVMPIRGDHRFLSILPLSHMFEQVAGFFYPLYNGCTVTYLYSRKSSTIIDALQRERVTVMVVVPALLHVLRENILREARAHGQEGLLRRLLAVAERLPVFLRRQMFNKVHQKLGGCLEMFITGGSALDPELERFWRAMGFAIYPGYGLTEASPVVALNTPAAHRSGSVGRCLPHQEVRLAAENEIWIRGANVTPGYLDNPAENAARFVDGWYRTGDIGEIDAEGFLYIRGRLKNMLKSSAGLNIYPEDVETVLNRIAGIKDSCVIGLEEGGDVRVHAVLLTDKSRACEAGAVRGLIDQANGQLQPHQHIQGFTLWPHEDFPRTNTLKIKRGPVQQEVATGRPAGGPVSQASGDRIFDLLADLAKVDVKTIQPESNLVTDLGLDSIARVELATLLEEEFNIEVDEASITPQTTVAGLKALIAAQQKAAAAYAFPRWAVQRPTRWLRAALNLFALRLPSFFSRTTVRGREHLSGIRSPVIFIANHISHYDTLYIARALPRRLRRRLAVAAAADILFDVKPTDSWRRWADVRFRGFWSVLLMNAFPFSRDVHIKKSFEYMGELIDHGWHVLLYPEGKLTLDGKINRFKSGIGLLTQAMNVPVVPVRIDGLFGIANHAHWIPQKFGRVSVTFGPPLAIDRRADPDAIAQECEAALRALGQAGVA